MEGCVFCKIVKGELPSKKVIENDEVVVLYDISPAAPVHVLVVPKKHIEKLSESKKKDVELLGKLQLTAVEAARKLGVEKAFRLITFNGEGAGQSVFHLHYHLQGGWRGRTPNFHNIK